jgi:hypothetical protein
MIAERFAAMMDQTVIRRHLKAVCQGSVATTVITTSGLARYLNMILLTTVQHFLRHEPSRGVRQFVCTF